jgi:hypothetical protein
MKDRLTGLYHKILRIEKEQINIREEKIKNE